MKIICISANEENTTPRISCGADSSVLRLGDPLFLPDHLGEWYSAVCPAVRLSRLGVNVHQKSASTFYDVITATHLLLPADADTLMLSGIYAVMDRAYAPGEWLDLESAHLSEGVKVEASVSEIRHFRQSSEVGQAPVTHTSERSLTAADIERAICRLSQYATLKMGDIIVFADYGVRLGKSEVDTVVEASIGGVKCLNLRIK